MPMKKQKPLSVKILQWVYLLVFCSSIVLVWLLHNIPSPFLDVLRVPMLFSFLESYAGVPYVTSITTYHFTFAYFLLIILIDAVSLFLYSSLFLRKLSLLSSIAGFFLIGFVGFYFAATLFILGFPNNSSGMTAFVFLVFSTALFLLDTVTFFIDEESLYGLVKHFHKKPSEPKNPAQ